MMFIAFILLYLSIILNIKVFMLISFILVWMTFISYVIVYVAYKKNDEFVIEAINMARKDSIHVNTASCVFIFFIACFYNFDVLLGFLSYSSFVLSYEIYYKNKIKFFDKDNNC